MWTYIVRRILWTIPIVLGIVLMTFFFFSVMAPDPARLYAGKIKSEEQLEAIRHRMGLDKPRWVNLAGAREGGAAKLFDSQFFDVLLFRFPQSMKYQDSVWALFARKSPVSLAIQLPVFLIEIGIQVVLALVVGSKRGRWPDTLVTAAAVAGMSLPLVSIYLGAQWFFGGYLAWFPVAGWEAWPFWVSFAALPILVSVLGGIGGGTRFYRTVVLEEVNSDYVRTARAKGVGRREVLLTHVMRNIMIPVLTNTMVALPGLLTGALILERMFQIPGMGGLLVEAIFNQDRPVVMAETYVLSIAYCFMLLVTDILYTLVDPRVSLR